MASPEPSFGSVLRELRIAQTLSQEALAERAGMSAAAISSLERGSRQAPYRSTVELLAAALGADDDVKRRMLQLAIRARKPRNASSRAGESPSLGQIPTWLNAFVARTTETAELTSLLRDRRLVTITGTGGTGKTRLAASVARGSAKQFPAGVFFVELATTSNPKILLEFVAATFGLSESPKRSLMEDLCAFLGDREALLVLDNCEHLGAAAADLATTLMKRCQWLHVLTTSRQPLHASGEAVYVLSPLARRDAAALFVERARDAGTPEPLAGREQAIESLCAALDGLPLAVELAAAQSRLQTIDDIRKGLERRTDVLQTVGPPTAPRHRTINDAIEWSYKLLSDDERQLFRALGAFPASWSTGVLGPVSQRLRPGADLARLHAALLDHSLITVVPSLDAYRYTYLETIRAFSVDRLHEHGEFDGANAALVAYALELVRRNAPRFGTRAESATLAELDAEYLTIRAAIEYATSHLSYAHAALELVQGMLEYWINRGAVSEGLEVFSGVLYGRNIDDNARDAARLGLCRLLRLNGRSAEAHTIDSITLERARGRDEPFLAASALASLAADEWDLQQLPQALERYEDALHAMRPFGDSPLIVRTLHCAATVAIVLKRYEQAQTLLDESQRAAARLGDQRGLAWVAFRRGFLAMEQRELERAEHYMTRSLDLRTVLDDQLGISGCFVALGIIRVFEKNYADAARSFRSCVEVSRRRGLAGQFLHIAEWVAYLAMLQGRKLEALSLLAAVSAKRIELSYPVDTAAAKDLAELFDLARESPPVAPVSDSLDDIADEALSLLDGAV